MTSPEQMNRQPEQPERKITTPEEWAEINKKRRKDFGLPEAKELTPEQTKELEESIEKLLKKLDKYNYNYFSPEIQEEWYFVEQEAGAGKDRELAKANLEKFLKILQEE